MDENRVNRSREPIRLFESDLLEALTHVHPAVVLIVWVPVAAAFFLSALVDDSNRGFPFHVPLGFAVGLFLWTWAEYMGHRFLFHFRPRAAWQARVLYVLHGVHHEQPQVKTRLVMPPALTVPLALLVYGGFYWVAGSLLSAPHWVAPLFSGFVIGYVVYDMVHYATHHLPARWRWLKLLKRYHMLHHFKRSDRYYGVSSPLWDVVFGTKPA